MRNAVFAGDELPVLLGMGSGVMLAGRKAIATHIALMFLVGFDVSDVDSVTYSHDLSLHQSDAHIYSGFCFFVCFVPYKVGQKGFIVYAHRSLNIGRSLAA